jgi:hypothetical protein
MMHTVIVMHATSRMFFLKKNCVLTLLRTRTDQLRQISFNRRKTKFIYKSQKTRWLQAEVGSPTRLQVDARTAQV